MFCGLFEEPGRISGLAVTSGEPKGTGQGTSQGTCEPPNGESFSVSELNLGMLWCQPGTFQMGSPEEEKDREEDETQHKVTLTKGFYLWEA